MWRGGRVPEQFVPPGLEVVCKGARCQGSASAQGGSQLGGAAQQASDGGGVEAQQLREGEAQQQGLRP